MRVDQRRANPGKRFAGAGDFQGFDRFLPPLHLGERLGQFDGHFRRGGCGLRCGAQGEDGFVPPVQLDEDLGFDLRRPRIVGRHGHRLIRVFQCSMEKGGWVGRGTCLRGKNPSEIRV